MTPAVPRPGADPSHPTLRRLTVVFEPTRGNGPARFGPGVPAVGPASWVPVWGNGGPKAHRGGVGAAYRPVLQ